jgi:multiple sugar transport system permease protein
MRRWFIAVVFAFISFLWIAPLVLVVSASMKSVDEFREGGFFTLTGSITQFFTNLANATEAAQLWSGFANSLLYGVVGAAAAVLISALASYALVWLRVRRPFLLFMLIYAGTVLPFQMYIIPLSQGYKAAQIYDTHLGMLLFYTAICIPFCTFVFRGYFLNVGDEILEAARVDGASRTRVFRSIVIPLSINPAVLLFLTQFLWIWNDLLFGQVLSSSSEVRPIMPALASLSGDVALATLPERMSAALLASVPAILLFLLLRKRFMQGLEMRA